MISVWIASPALLGDVLYLTNGNRIEGRVETLANGDYRVTVDVGNVVTLRSHDIERRERAEAPLDELERRAREVKDGDRKGLVELAAWAEIKGLRKGALSVYRRLLQIDPHHEGARHHLGYVLHRNRWVRRSELKGLGFVRFRGAWRTEEEVARIKREEAETQFTTLLADVQHDNKFIRENARYQLVEVRDPRLVPLLKRRLQSSQPVERLVCAQVLANQGFAAAARPIYDAWLRERRSEVETGLVALLVSWKDGRVGQWNARDLEKITAEASAGEVGKRLDFFERFPHRAALRPWLRVGEFHPAFRGRIDRVFTKRLGVESRSSDEWSAYLDRVESSLPLDLGTGWIERHSTPR